jgi:transposase InsO family protein
VPWKETCTVEDQRVACIAEWLEFETPVVELATRYGVSRKTIYKWLERFEEQGPSGLADRSRAPHHHGRAMPKEVQADLLTARREHPTWGPRKIRARLQKTQPAVAWPAPSSIGELYRRQRLSAPRRRTRYVVPLTTPLAAAVEPNDVWTADFKGWFRTADGTRCDPLTINDAASRFALCCQIVPPTGPGVRPWFERTFREYGLPRALRTDNGSPFASTGPGRLSRLSVWWLKLGIALDPIDPGHPEQNGRHERFHLTLQTEATQPPARTPREQQRRFDQVRRCYNAERPHEALENRCPSDLYVPSPRPYPARVEDAWYDATHQVRRVRNHGQIKWQGDLVFISEAVIGELVGVQEVENGDWRVHFLHRELGRIDRKTRRFTAAWWGRPRRRRAPEVDVVPPQNGPVLGDDQDSPLRSDPADAGPHGS